MVCCVEDQITASVFLPCNVSLKCELFQIVKHCAVWTLQLQFVYNSQVHLSAHFLGWGKVADGNLLQVEWLNVVDGELSFEVEQHQHQAQGCQEAVVDEQPLQQFEVHCHLLVVVLECVWEAVLCFAKPSCFFANANGWWFQCYWIVSSRVHDVHVFLENCMTDILLEVTVEGQDLPFLLEECLYTIDLNLDLSFVCFFWILKLNNIILLDHWSRGFKSFFFI